MDYICWLLNMRQPVPLYVGSPAETPVTFYSLATVCRYVSVGRWHTYTRRDKHSSGINYAAMDSPPSFKMRIFSCTETLANTIPNPNPNPSPSPYGDFAQTERLAKNKNGRHVYLLLVFRVSPVLKTEFRSSSFRSAVFVGRFSPFSE